MSGGKPATEDQLRNVLDTVENLYAAVKCQQEALKDLLEVVRRQGNRITDLEREEAV